MPSKLTEMKYQSDNQLRLLRLPQKFVTVENLLALALLATAAHAQTSQFVGSATCKRCHTEIFDSWSKTRMANIVTDPADHPEVIIQTWRSPIHWSNSPRKTSPMSTGASGNSAIS